MAEKSTFFNSVSGDRKYKAEDMAAHFAKLITNGVYPAGTQLQVTEDTGMNVTVSAGSAWINGYAYHNDGDFTLTFDPADGVLNRIDRIVVRWGRLARSINLAIIKGTPGSSPSAPAIVRSADYYDLGIATVSIGAGITAITQAMITDTRLDSNVCGLVSSLIQPDTSGWFAQFNAAFLDWFETLEDVLDENAAANLLNLINDLAGVGRTDETVKGISDALLSHKEESATQAHLAKNILVQDLEGNFTSNPKNVENVLKEVFLSGNNVKINTVGALLSVDPNLPITDQSAWDAIINSIGQITTGKKWASGTAMSYGPSVEFERSTDTYKTGDNIVTSITVTGLTFKPSFIYLVETTSHWKVFSLYTEMYDGNYSKPVKTAINASHKVESGYSIKGDVAPASVTSSGFVLPVLYAAGSGNPHSFNWIAFE